MIECVGGRIYLFKVCSGEIKEIDLIVMWYCLYCIEWEELFLFNVDGLGLYCKVYYEYCEYEYWNKVGRDNFCVIWFDGYKYLII